jgi:predicted esterase
MLSHHHLFIRGAEPGHTPLLLLHGSGGTERDMVPLAAELSPKSAVVALRGAVLFRPLSPLAADSDSRVPRTPVLIIDGSDDERRSPGDGARLAKRLAGIGADVTHHVLPTGHSLIADDLRLAREWLAQLPVS